MVDTSFFINNGPFTLQQVAEICEAELQNAEKAGVTVNNINTMEKAGAGEICFFYVQEGKGQGRRNQGRGLCDDGGTGTVRG